MISQGNLTHKCRKNVYKLLRIPHSWLFHFVPLPVTAGEQEQWYNYTIKEAN